MSVETVDQLDIARQRAEAILAFTTAWTEYQKARKTAKRLLSTFVAAASNAAALGVSFGQIGRTVSVPTPTVHRWIQEHRQAAQQGRKDRVK